MYKNIEKQTALELREQVDYQAGQIISRTLVQNELMSMTLFAFEKGEEISTHAAGGVGADLLALFKCEQGHAHQLILHQGAADDLTGLIVHLFPQLQGGLLFDILIHDTLLLVP